MWWEFFCWLIILDCYFTFFVSIEAYILSFFVLYSTYLLVAVQRPLGDRGKRTIRLDVGYWRG